MIDCHLIWQGGYDFTWRLRSSVVAPAWVRLPASVANVAPFLPSNGPANFASSWVLEALTVAGRIWEETAHVRSLSADYNVSHMISVRHAR